jgi:hypothetical protein
VEYSIVLDQLSLRRWFGSIDATDAILIGFIRGLNSHNPAVAARMKDGLFELSREWIHDEIPLLDVSVDWIGRRLSSLRKLGIVELKTEHVGQRFHTYGKLSKLYFAEVEKAKRDVEKRKSERDCNPAETNSERDSGPVSRGEKSRNHDSLKNHEEPSLPPALGGGGKSRLLIRCPACERDLGEPSDEGYWTCLHCQTWYQRDGQGALVVVADPRVKEAASA